MMQNKSLISVIIPTYNYDQFIKRAIESVLKQDYKNIEVIICDDGSTDKTKLIIRKLLNDKRVSYYFQPNKGLSAARNLGINKAKGKYLAFLDSDDYWMPGKLSSQFKLFQRNQKLGLVYCFHYWVDLQGKIIGKKIKKYRGNIWPNLLQGNLISGSGSSVLIKKICFKKVGVFDQTLSACEDWDMWLRISKVFQVDFVPRFLVNITQHQKRMSLNKWSLFKNRIKVMSKNIKQISFTNFSHLENFMKSVKILLSELIFK